MLDNIRPIATPEGIELGLRLAGPVPRALAWLIDFSWRLALLIVLAISMASLGNFGGGIWLLAAFLLEWLAPAWFEVKFHGATPGKRAMGLRVLGEDGAPIGWHAALARNLMRAADFLPFLYLGGLLSMLISPRFQRLGDLVAGTIVVHVDRGAAGRRIPEGDPIAPGLALELAEKRAVLDFAERVAFLSPARAQELALLPQPLVAGCDGPQAVVRLQGIANHLLGGKRQDGGARAAG